jgi:hypothetical protein
MIGFGLAQLWRLLTLTDPGAWVPVLGTLAIGAVVACVLKGID